MSKVTKIVWSGVTGRTGREAMTQAIEMPDVKIVCGMARVSSQRRKSLRTPPFFYLFYDEPGMRTGDLAKLVERAKTDIMIDFSHPDVFEQVVEIAVRTHVPLISGTSGLSDRQMEMLYGATNQIPIFHGGIFRFKLKDFADKAIEFAKEHDDLVLTEQHWVGQPLPTEFAKAIGKRILRETGKTLQIINGAPYAADSYINEWTLYGDDSTENFISCKVRGYDELAHDVLEIAKVMVTKPIKKGEFYNLDGIWDELPH